MKLIFESGKNKLIPVNFTVLVDCIRESTVENILFFFFKKNLASKNKLIPVNFTVLVDYIYESTYRTFFLNLVSTHAYFLKLAV